MARHPRATTPRREAILNATLIAAGDGGYEAVQMRAIAQRAGIAVGTLYRYFPSKTHLLVAALTREFQRLDAVCDWAATGATRQQRLNRLTTRLHDEWQRAPLLTEAMTRTFLAANATAASEVNQAATVIERVLARALGGGQASTQDRQVAGLIADVWLANLAAFIGQRASATEARDRIEWATRRILASDAAGSRTLDEQNGEPEL
jgi:AcrR family transcriptional regulator